MLIDTHSHVNFKAFKDDFNEVIRRSLDENVWMITIGSQYLTSQKAVEIAKKYEQGVYSAVGLHPVHAEDGFDYEKYKQLAQSPKNVAIGEIGLDYKKEYVSFKEKQKKVFLEQLELSKELNLPIIFHCRMAHQDLIEILNSQSDFKLKGVIHCFTGNQEQAKKYLEIGLYLGFNGIIFSEKLDLKEVIQKTPLEKMLIETDCPYLTPPIIGRSKRNEPIYVKYVAEEIAKIRNISYEEVIDKTTENARKLFQI